MSARFGEMLLDRRRQLGLSIQQVANTIKIRPQIIEFFETGNFASMPPRGYAQGMISTYARFLGLNPRQVVNAYFDELMAYERETSQRGGRFQDAAGYVNTRSSTESGRFLMIEGGRSSRYGQRPQQAGYVTETGSGREIREQRDRFRNTLPPSDSALPQSLGNVSDPRAGYGDGGYSARGMRLASARGRGADQGNPDRAPRHGTYGRDPHFSSRDGRPRSNRSAERAYSRNAAPSSGRNRQQGRPGSPSRASQGRSSGRGRSSQPQAPQFDQRLMLAGLGVIAVLLILVAFLLMRGCTPAETSDTPTKTATQQVASGSGSSKSSASDASDSSDEDASSSSSNKKDEDTNVKVKVSVAKGKTAWIEIKVDGKSVYGAQATGPFEQEYSPESSIEITTSKPSDVTVTKNGEKVRYDTKTSGVARVTITVPKKTSDTDGDPSSDDSTTSDGTDSQSTDGASADSSADGSASDSGTGSDSAATATYSSTGTSISAQTDSSQGTYSPTGTSQ